MLVNLTKDEIKTIIDVLKGGQQKNLPWTSTRTQLKDKLQGIYDACTCKEQKEAN